VWNPARDVAFLTVENPAHDIIGRLDVDVGQNFNQQFLDGFVEKRELAMRQPHYDSSFTFQRRGQDSNLRTGYPITDLANRRFRPLSHLSD
jgi:hypothetical protein